MLYILPSYKWSTLHLLKACSLVLCSSYRPGRVLQCECQVWEAGEAGLVTSRDVHAPAVYMALLLLGYYTIRCGKHVLPSYCTSQTFDEGAFFVLEPW